MVGVRFSINTTSQMKDFIFFLYKSGLRLEREEEDSFYELLYESIKEKKVYPLWLKKENLVRYLEYLKMKYDPKIGEINCLLSEVYQRPTPEFAKECGRENLNKDGFISKSWAYHFIMNQVKLRNIPVIDDIIHVDDYLQKLFGINSVKIDKYELIDLLDNLFI
jgi:hypothetical protein